MAGIVQLFAYSGLIIFCSPSGGLDIERRNGVRDPFAGDDARIRPEFQACMSVLGWGADAGEDGVAAMVEKTHRRKRVKLSEGDIFEMPLPDGKLGYGIILRRGGLTSGGTPYIGIYHAVHSERQDATSIVCGEIVLTGWTTDSLIHQGNWTVTAGGMPLPSVPFPNFKVAVEGKMYVTDVEGQLLDEATLAERELLDYQFSRTATCYQDAFEALNGFRNWDVNYEKLTPAYSAARVTRPTS